MVLSVTPGHHVNLYWKHADGELLLGSVKALGKHRLGFQLVPEIRVMRDKADKKRKRKERAA